MRRSVSRLHVRVRGSARLVMFPKSVPGCHAAGLLRVCSSYLRPTALVIVLFGAFIIRIGNVRYAVRMNDRDLRFGLRLTTAIVPLRRCPPTTELNAAWRTMEPVAHVEDCLCECVWVVEFCGYAALRMKLFIEANRAADESREGGSHVVELRCYARDADEPAVDEETRGHACSCCLEQEQKQKLKRERERKRVRRHVQ